MEAREREEVSRRKVRRTRGDASDVHEGLRARDPSRQLCTYERVLRGSGALINYARFADLKRLRGKARLCRPGKPYETQ